MGPDGVSNPVFARLFHRFRARDRGRGEDEIRRRLLAGLRGRVVEVGAGNGINFEYLPASVAELVAVEPDPYLRPHAERAARYAPVRVRVSDGLAERLPLDDGAADAVVVAGVLCSVADPAAALAEVHRVLRPGGELRFYEHVRSERPRFGRYQDLVAPVWSRLMGGCEPNRETLTAIEAAGFTLAHCRRFGFPHGARAYPVLPRILGVAVR